MNGKEEGRYERGPGGPRHTEVRSVLRVVGPALLLVGLILTVIGMASFFSSFGTGGMPRYFWCAFIGLPLMGLGGGICKFAFLGSIGRYVAGEAAPVVKDTLNYVAEGTAPGIEKVARAVAEGISGKASGGGSKTVILCHKCNEKNDADARFCKRCGAALAKTKKCPACGELNDPDARFCDECGHAFS